MKDRHMNVGLSEQTAKYFQAYKLAYRQSWDLRDPTKLQAHFQKYLSSDRTVQVEMEELDARDARRFAHAVEMKRFLSQITYDE